MRTQLVLITAGFPFGTGETFLENEIAFLADEFEHVHIVCPDTLANTPRTLPENCTVYRFNNQLTTSDKIRAFSGLFASEFRNEMGVVRQKYGQKVSLGIVKTALISLFQAKRLARFLKNQFLPQNDSEKWVFYSYWCDDAAVALAFLSMQYDVLKTVTRMHRWDIYFEENTYNYLPFRYKISSHLDSIFSISQDGIDYAVSTWKVDRSKFILSRLGVKKGIENDSFRYDSLHIVSCSNVIPVKRVHLIYEALNLIEDLKIEWTHFGDGEQFYLLNEKVQTLQSNIQTNLKGRIPNNEIYVAYRELQPKIFINVSSSEGVPVSIMEAMSFGIPVIATNVGGNSEIVNNQNGILLSDNPTPQEIKAAIEEVLAHPEKREAAFQTWNEFYHAEKNYTEFVKSLQLL